MFRMVPARRSPAMTLALMAVLGLLLRALPVPAAPVEVPFASFPAFPGFAAFTVPLCHAGAGGQRHPDHSDAGCDACLLCMAVHGDHAGMGIVPRATELPAVSVANVAPRRPAGLATPRVAASTGTWARAPPGAA
jgi:hypothetical protein